jgi:hypothetical protein
MQGRIKFLSSFLLVLLLIVYSAVANAQTSAPSSAPAAETTLAVFPDSRAKPMPEEFWQELVAALRQELLSGEAETRTLSVSTSATASDRGRNELPSDESETSGDSPELPLQILRGDKIGPGLVVNKSITVYLLGECKATPTPQFGLYHSANVSGALGWVPVENGQIQPFIHVDCGRIGQMLGQHSLGLSADQRQRQMANAVARVILHEWIHIATQNPHHAKHGIAKAEFGIDDLLARPARSSSTPSPQCRSGD